jgi:CHAD domain-containing protein
MPARELRLSSPPGFRFPALSTLDDGARALDAREEQFQTIEFDTGDLRVARGGARVRHHSVDGWVVELTEGDPSAARPLLTIPGDVGPPPDRVVDLVTALTRGEPLQPAAKLRTLRRRIPLVDDTGAAVGELVEDEVSVLEGVHLAARYRELRVAVAAGAPDGLADSLAARLQAAGAGPADSTPPIVRALGWRALDPPDVAPAAVGGDASAGEAVQAALAASVARLLRHDPGVRIGDDPEDVHQARVAVRRLRSDLRTFRGLLAADWNATLRDELRWLGAELGTVRDTEVLTERLQGRLEALPVEDRAGAAPLLAHLRERWDACRAELLTALRSPRYVQLLDRLVLAAREPALLPEAAEPAAAVLPSLVAGPWRHLRDAVEGLGDEPADEALHEIRIRAKRCRYAAEAVAPVVGKPAREFARAIAAVQEVLGEHQDAVVAEHWLRAVAGTADASESFVAGELTALERAAAARARDEWWDVWRDARRKRLRSWL